MPTAVEELKTIGDVQRVVLELVHENSGDRADATKDLRKIIKNSAIETIVIEYAIARLIDEAMLRGRTALFRRVESNGNVSADERATLAYAEVLLDLEVRPGLRLRHATREDLFEKAAELEAHARGTVKHAKYLRKIGNRLKPGEKVEDQMSDNELAQIMVIARKESEKLIP